MSVSGTSCQATGLKEVSGGFARGRTGAWLREESRTSLNWRNSCRILIPDSANNRNSD